MISAAFVGPLETIDRVYGQGRKDEIAKRIAVHANVVSDLEANVDSLKDVEAIFTTWGGPTFPPNILDRLPHLRIVFYAAGTVQYFAPDLLARGIKVVSAWHANAVPVAEFTLAQILLSCKGYFRNVQDFAAQISFDKATRGPGGYGEIVALLGAGAIGRRLIDLLASFDLSVIVYDPFLEDAAIEKVTLEEAFARGLVVSNHLADKPDTENLIRREHFEAMRPGATFINTGRGRTVDHGALYEVFAARRDLTALLDVVWPEPLPADSPLRTLPNVQVSTHIAGSIGNEVVRLADYMIEELDRYLAGRSLRYEVTDLSRMA